MDLKLNLYPLIPKKTADHTQNKTYSNKKECRTPFFAMITKETSENFTKKNWDWREETFGPNLPWLIRRASSWMCREQPAA
jgi:hypothetical protein